MQFSTSINSYQYESFLIQCLFGCLQKKISSTHDQIPIEVTRSSSRVKNYQDKIISSFPLLLQTLLMKFFGKIRKFSTCLRRLYLFFPNQIEHALEWQALGRCDISCIRNPCNDLIPCIAVNRAKILNGNPGTDCKMFALVSEIRRKS